MDKVYIWIKYIMDMDKHKGMKKVRYSQSLPVEKTLISLGYV